MALVLVYVLHETFIRYLLLVILLDGIDYPSPLCVLIVTIIVVGVVVNIY